MTAQIIEFPKKPKKSVDGFDAAASLTLAPIRANIILMQFLLACQIEALKDKHNDRTRSKDRIPNFQA